MRTIAFLLLSALIAIAAVDLNVEFEFLKREILFGNVPTAEPTADPTIMPSAVPSVYPTNPPSVAPTTSPTVNPTVDPTTPPTLAPTASPSMTPSTTPTVMPTIAPTDMPTVIPTLMPTEIPTFMPTLTPTTMPSNPSARPTKMPTVNPTANPTASPTVNPTARPTAAPTKLNLIAVSAQQTLNGISTSDYLSNQASYNKTIQGTVASCLTGVDPSNVQDIALTGGQRRRMTSGSSASVSYNIIFHDASNTQSYASVVNDLQIAAATGVMNTYLHQQAQIYGATALAQSNFSSTVSAQPYFKAPHVSKLLSGTEIAGVVIGTFLCLGLIALVAVFFFNAANNASSNGDNNSSSSSAVPAADPAKPADAV